MYQLLLLGQQIQVIIVELQAALAAAVAPIIVRIDAVLELFAVTLRTDAEHALRIATSVHVLWHDYPPVLLSPSLPNISN